MNQKPVSPTPATKTGFSYHEILSILVSEAESKPDRTASGTVSYQGITFKHHMGRQGFPLCTLRRIAFKPIRVELQGFLGGITSKRWYQERGCRFWDSWANPQVAPYGHSEAARGLMRDSDDLGPVYGYQWRHFDRPYLDGHPVARRVTGGIDQLANAIEALKVRPHSRRISIEALNPAQEHQMSIPSCIVRIQFTVTNGELNLFWEQRSSDVAVGLPCDIASMGLLLHLVAREVGLAEGQLTGFLVDAHIYLQNLEHARAIAQRSPTRAISRLETQKGVSIDSWTHEDTRLRGYCPLSAMETGPVAI